MAWPSGTDYKAALQFPDRVFVDPVLRSCRPDLDKWGLPVGIAGGFAIVYKLSNGSATTAVRVYLAPPPRERQDRYRIVDRYLQQGKPGCVVEFKYDPEGAVMGSQKVPVMTMTWVGGTRLDKWMKEAVARRDAAAVRRMADLWIDLLDDLRAAGIAHGDLQHGNVMVVGDALVLVDYDCMCVPDLVGQDAWENGLPAYQHPERLLQKLSLDLDHFSAWIILIALRATAADLSLWNRFVDLAENENLLFGEHDIAQPDRSALWPALLTSPDAEVREWSKQLRDSIGSPFSQVPPFQIDTFGPLREVCARQDWDAVWDLVRGPQYARKVIPPDVVPVIGEARKRVTCREALQTALGSKDPRAIAKAYVPALLDDWPACRHPDLIGPAQEALKTVKALDELLAATAHAGDGRALIALWDRHAGRVGPLAEAAPVQEQVARWRKRIDAAQKLLDALKAKSSERAIAAAWKALEDAGGHPDADPHRKRAEQAARRSAALDKLKAVPTAEDEKTDRRLLAEWEAVSTLLNDCREAGDFQRRAVSARSRILLVDQLNAVIGQADQGLAPEQGVLDAAGPPLPPGYLHSHQARVQKARIRLASEHTLLDALRAQPQSDQVIAAAWDEAGKAGSQTKDARIVERCHLALRRRDLLLKLNAIPKTIPIDEQDARWLGQWDEGLLGDCHDALPLRPRLNESRERKATWEALEEALRGGDIAAVKRLKDHPLLARHPGLEKRRTEIAERVRASERVDELVGTLRANDHASFLRLLDLSLLSEYAPSFTPHRRQIEQWVDVHVLQAKPLNPGQPPAIVGEGARHVTARWTWKFFHLIRSCRIAADPSRFFDRPDDAPGGTFRLTVDQHRMGGGYVLTPKPGWRKLHVTIWPVVDLGWTERIGPPLALGPIALSTAAGPPKPSANGKNSLLQGLWEKMLNW